MDPKAPSRRDESAPTDTVSGPVLAEASQQPVLTDSSTASPQVTLDRPPARSSAPRRRGVPRPPPNSSVGIIRESVRSSPTAQVPTFEPIPASPFAPIPSKSPLFGSSGGERNPSVTQGRSIFGGAVMPQGGSIAGGVVVGRSVPRSVNTPPRPSVLDSMYEDDDEDDASLPLRRVASVPHSPPRRHQDHPQRRASASVPHHHARGVPEPVDLQAILLSEQEGRLRKAAAASRRAATSGDVPPPVVDPDPVRAHHPSPSSPRIWGRDPASPVPAGGHQPDDTPTMSFPARFRDRAVRVSAFATKLTIASLPPAAFSYDQPAQALAISIPYTEVCAIHTLPGHANSTLTDEWVLIQSGSWTTLHSLLISSTHAQAFKPFLVSAVRSASLYQDLEEEREPQEERETLPVSRLAAWEERLMERQRVVRHVMPRRPIM